MNDISLIAPISGNDSFKLPPARNSSFYICRIHHLMMEEEDRPPGVGVKINRLWQWKELVVSVRRNWDAQGNTCRQQAAFPHTAPWRRPAPPINYINAMLTPISTKNHNPLPVFSRRPMPLLFTDRKTGVGKVKHPGNDAFCSNILSSVCLVIAHLFKGR